MLVVLLNQIVEKLVTTDVQRQRGQDCARGHAGVAATSATVCRRGLTATTGLVRATSISSILELAVANVLN